MCCRNIDRAISAALLPDILVAYTDKQTSINIAYITTNESLYSPNKHRRQKKQ